MLHRIFDDIRKSFGFPQSHKINMRIAASDGLTFDFFNLYDAVHTVYIRKGKIHSLYITVY